MDLNSCSNGILSQGKVGQINHQGKVVWEKSSEKSRQGKLLRKSRQGKGRGILF